MNYENRRNNHKQYKEQHRGNKNKFEINIDIENVGSRGLIKEAEEVGQKLKSASSSSLRKIYDALLEKEKIDDVYALKPLLAYMSGRKLVDKDFYKAVDNLINKIKTAKGLENFKKFFEAVIAYHKYYGGKD